MTELSHLAQSPLDDTEQSRWVHLLLGTVVGLVVTGVALVASGASETSPSSTNPTVAPTAAVASEPLRFPPGYTAVNDTVAFKPHHVTTMDTELIVSMTTAHARDANAPNDRFIGGRWALDTTSGKLVTSDITRFSDTTGGAFAVVFPAVAAQAVEQLRLIEWWQPDDSEVTFNVPVDGALNVIGYGPFEEPIGDLTLRIGRLMIPNILEGSVLWQLDGPLPHVGTVAVGIRMLDGEGSTVALASSPTGQVHGLDATEGTTGFAIVPADGGPLSSATEQQDFMSAMRTVRTLVVTATVTTGKPEPTEDVVFDLGRYIPTPLEELVNN